MEKKKFNSNANAACRCTCVWFFFFICCDFIKYNYKFCSQDMGEQEHGQANDSRNYTIVQFVFPPIHVMDHVCFTMAENFQQSEH